MDRINSANMAPGRKFRDADPGVGQKATSMTALWHNNVQEEICYPILQAGMALDPADTTQLLKALLLLNNPIGTVRTFSDLAFNPATYFGGTWAKIAVGRVQVNYDAAQTEFNAVGKTGGAKTVALTGAQNGAHVHGTDIGASGTPNVAQAGASASANQGAHQTASSGAGDPHENMPPFQVTGNTWERTA